MTALSFGRIFLGYFIILRLLESSLQITCHRTALLMIPLLRAVCQDYAWQNRNKSLMGWDHNIHDIMYIFSIQFFSPMNLVMSSLNMCFFVLFSRCRLIWRSAWKWTGMNLWCGQESWNVYLPCPISAPAPVPLPLPTAQSLSYMSTVFTLER